MYHILSACHEFCIIHVSFVSTVSEIYFLGLISGSRWNYMLFFLFTPSIYSIISIFDLRNDIRKCFESIYSDSISSKLIKKYLVLMIYNTALELDIFQLYNIRLYPSYWDNKLETELDFNLILLVDK